MLFFKIIFLMQGLLVSYFPYFQTLFTWINYVSNFRPPVCDSAMCLQSSAKTRKFTFLTKSEFFFWLSKFYKGHQNRPAKGMNVWNAMLAFVTNLEEVSKRFVFHSVCVSLPISEELNNERGWTLLICWELHARETTLWLKNKMTLILYITWRSTKRRKKCCYCSGRMLYDKQATHMYTRKKTIYENINRKEVEGGNNRTDGLLTMTWLKSHRLKSNLFLQVRMIRVRDLTDHNEVTYLL